MTARTWIARTPLLAAFGFLALFVGAPLLFMVFSTVNGPEGLTFEPWRALLANPVDRAQLRYSLELGSVATAVAILLGLGHTWLTHRTDLPLGRWLAPLGFLPLIVPPILVAMAFSDLVDVANLDNVGVRSKVPAGGPVLSVNAAPGVAQDGAHGLDFAGFWPCALMLGCCYAPFVAVLAAAGLRAIDGRQYEAALIARGRGAANRLLLRSIAPEIAAGALFAFIFVVSEHGVPEFLTVKGKVWHTYAEGIFSRWTRRMVGTTHDAAAAPVVAAVPLVGLIAVSLWMALRLRARATIRGDVQALPIRPLGPIKRWLGLLLPVGYLTAGVLVPIVVMARWAMGSTNLRTPTTIDQGIASLRLAFREAGDDLAYTTGIAGLTVALVIGVAVPMALAAARGRGGRPRRWIEYLAVLPIAVPTILLGIGIVRVFNRDLFGNFYDAPAIVACAYTARYLPFGVLTLAAAARRVPAELGEAAMMTGRGPIQRAIGVHLPLVMPAIWSAACLIFVLALRELDMAVVLSAGNGTVVRRLSNVVHFGGEDLGGALALLLLLIGIIVPLVTVLITGRKLRSLH